MRAVVILLSVSSLSSLAVGCGGRTGLGAPNVADACPTEAPTCVERPGSCEAPRLVTATCDAASKQWSCPSRARKHERVEAATCSPLSEHGVIAGSLARVPTDDGRCLWIAERVGDDRNVAFEIDEDAPFGSCPTRARAVRTNVVVGEDVVQITGGYRLNGAARVTYRQFKSDPAAPFGVTESGTGIARWRDDRIVIEPTRFATDLDLGDASIVIGDHAYLYGCPGPPDFLTEHCVVGRLDGRDEMELFVGGGRWVGSTRARDAQRVFDSGPWISSVVARPNGLLHVYAVGFGSNLETHTATTPDGPWAKGGNLAPCDLPGDDPKAFCAGPVVHAELSDPTRPSELVVSYGVGSTSPERGGREHASRLQWLPGI